MLRETAREARAKDRSPHLGGILDPTMGNTASEKAGQNTNRLGGGREASAKIERGARTCVLSSVALNTICS